MLKKAKIKHFEDREDGKKIAGCGEIYTHVILKVWEAETEGLPQSGCSLSLSVLVSLPAAVIQNTLLTKQLREERVYSGSEGTVLAGKPRQQEIYNQSESKLGNGATHRGSSPPN